MFRPELNIDYVFVIAAPDVMPELKLWAAVFGQAIKDLTSRSDRIRSETLEWFLSDRVDMNSFVGICLLFGFDIDRTRKMILDKRT